jgi:thiol-disulfide isomerase/thioredoxin
MMRHVLAAGLILTLGGLARAEGTLAIGDPAPKLQVKEFVKGDPVKELEKGKVYVVEFWATWCPPCRESIPHLTKLQKEHKDVTFIGVSVSEQDFDKVKPFVEKMGDKMEYRVAVDDVPEGKKADAGAMNKHWMAAAEQDGIPTAFVIDKDGKVAWIGHPMEMDKPLGEIAAGKWDLKAAAVAYKEEKAREKKMQQIGPAIMRGMRSGDLKDALAGIDDVVKDDPKAKAMIAQALNQLAWQIADPDQVKRNKPPAKQLQAALDAANKAVDLTGGKESALLDTLACAHFANGDAAKAIETEEKALKLKPDDAELKEHLTLFKKANDKDDKKDDK